MLMTVFEGEAKMQWGNFASCQQQQHSTCVGVLRITILETWRGEDPTEKARRDPNKNFSEMMFK